MPESTGRNRGLEADLSFVQDMIKRKGCMSLSLAIINRIGKILQC